MKTMTRDDIVQIGRLTFANLRKFYESSPKDFIIRFSSGTSGGVPMMIVSKLRRYRSITDSDAHNRVLACFGSNSTRIAYLLRVSNADVVKGESDVLFLDGTDLKPSLKKLLADFAAKRAYAFPSFILKVAQYMDSGTKKKILSIECGGEMVTSVLKKNFSTQFSNARLIMLYISAETGAIAQSCKHLPLNHYHPADGVTIEIDNQDDTGVGDVLVSKALDEFHFIERYAIGDMGRLINQRCPCGKTLTLEHFGRGGYDYIKLAGALLVREEFERVVHAVFPWANDFFVEVEQLLADNDVKGRITLLLYGQDTATEAHSHEELIRKFENQIFVTTDKTLAVLINEKRFEPMIVKTMDTPRVKTGKDVKLKLITK